MGQDFINAVKGMGGPSIRDQLYKDTNLGRLETFVKGDYRAFKLPYDFRKKGPMPSNWGYTGYTKAVYVKESEKDKDK